MEATGDLFLQLGAGGTIAYLIVKEVLAFVSKLRARESEEREETSANRTQELQADQMRAAIDTLEALTKTCNEQSEVLKELAAEQQRQAHQISDLHEAVSKEDDDGVRLIYRRASLERAIVSLSENVKNQTLALQEMARTGAA